VAQKPADFLRLLGSVWFSFLSQIRYQKSVISTKGVQKENRFSKIFRFL
jgi:hypothetical protein